MKPSVQEFQIAAAEPDRAERTLKVATVLSDALRAAGAEPVLVGGGAVEVYTRSAYTTHDLDFVAASTNAVAEAMAALGFEHAGRHWLHRALTLTVELPGSVLHSARSVSIDVAGSELRIIAVEDLIVDRLASWIHWHWDADGASAALLIAIHGDLDAERLAERAVDTGVIEALRVLRDAGDRQELLTPERLHALRTGMQEEQPKELND